MATATVRVMSGARLVAEYEVTSHEGAGETDFIEEAKHCVIKAGYTREQADGFGYWVAKK